MKPFAIILPHAAFFLLAGAFLCGLSIFNSNQGIAAEALPANLPDWASVLETHGNLLTNVDSDQSAKDTFVSTLGPALHLADAAGTIAAKGLPPKLAKELLLSDVIRSAQRLIAALTTWRRAEDVFTQLRVIQEPGHEPPSTPSSQQLEWLQANGPFPSLPELWQSSSTGRDVAHELTARALAAAQTSMEASQQAMAEWLRLRSWKDRVRGLRGQARLCGTWQWVIHNHQAHHQEQKFSLLFPPAGSDGAGIPGLAEMIVLGDTVYLRWETNGKTQEDSLLFSKEGQRLEGTFVNSQGGWGSISGKRTATCAPSDH